MLQKDRLSQIMSCTRFNVMVAIPFFSVVDELPTACLEASKSCRSLEPAFDLDFEFLKAVTSSDSPV